MPRWSDRRVKPPYGTAEIDWSHPWTRGLRQFFVCNEGAGAPSDLVSGRAITVTGSPQWEGSAHGLALTLDAVDDKLSAPASRIGLNVGAMWVLCQWITASPGAGSYRQFFDTDAARHAIYYDGDNAGIAIYNDGRVTAFPKTYAAGEVVSFFFYYNKTGNVQRFWDRGAEVTGNAPGGTWGATALGANWYVGQRFNGVDLANIRLAAFATWDVAPDLTMPRGLHAEPYVLLRPVPARRHYIIPPAGVTGTGAVTFTASAIAATGLEVFSGTGSLTPPTSTIAATGSEVLTGSASVTFAVSAIASSASEVFTGTGAVTLPVSTIAASGLEVFTGTGAVTFPVSTLAGTGAEAFTSTAAVTFPVSAIAGTGAEVFTGTGAVTFAGSTLAATGTNTPPAITGTAAVTFPVSTLASTGNVVSAGFAGSADVTVGVSALVGTGLEVFTGTASIAPPVSALAGTGTAVLAITGTGAVTLPVSDIAASGQVVVAITGTGAVTFPVSQINGVGNNGAVTVVGGGGFGGSIYLKTPIPALPEVLVEVPTIRGRGAVSFPVSQIQGTGVVAAVGAGAVRRRVSAIRGQGAVSLAGFGAVVGQRVSQVRGSGQVLLRDDATFSLELEDLDLELA